MINCHFYLLSVRKYLPLIISKDVLIYLNMRQTMLVIFLARINFVATSCCDAPNPGCPLTTRQCNTPKYTLVVFDMFRVFCKLNLNVS